MTEPQDAEATRARWKLAKRSQRARTKSPPRPLPLDLKRRIFDERDRRYSAASWSNLLKLNVSAPHSVWRMRCFTSNVWAARIVLEYEFGPEGVGPTKIADWLWHEGLQGSYARSSLRPMIYHALTLIDMLESTKIDGNDAPIWPPFAGIPVEAGMK